MSGNGIDVRGPVLAWTLFTTVFVWTPTMRLLLKPEISHWSFFGLSGSGRSEAFWIFPLLAFLALTLFYLEGRGRLRPLFHLLLLGWHLPLTAGILYGSIRDGNEARFVGGAWGVEIPFPVLAIPFVLFSLLVVLWVVQETRGTLPVPETSWAEVGWGTLAVAALLLPVAALFFRLGEGYDVWVKIAIAATVIQWILLAEGLRGPRSSGGSLRNRTPEGAVAKP